MVFQPLTTMTNVLLFLYLLVVLSGLFGLLAQNTMPRMMLNSLSHETIGSQVDEICRQRVEDAERLVASVFPERTHPVEHRASHLGTLRDTGILVIGAERNRPVAHIRMLRGNADLSVIASHFETAILPYLRNGKSSGSQLADEYKSERFFSALEATVHPTVKPIVAALKDFCFERRQNDRQRFLERFLNGWQLVHVPATGLLFVLLVMHIHLSLN